MKLSELIQKLRTIDKRINKPLDNSEDVIDPEVRIGGYNDTTTCIDGAYHDDNEKHVVIY